MKGTFLSQQTHTRTIQVTTYWTIVFISNRILLLNYIYKIQLFSGVIIVFLVLHYNVIKNL